MKTGAQKHRGSGWGAATDSELIDHLAGLVERLTDNDHCPAGTVDCYSRCRGLMQQAADTLTAQQQEIVMLWEALHEIKLLPHHNDVSGNELICRAADIADTALT